MKSHHTVAIGTWGGDKQQLIEYNSCIAVGIDCPRAKLRVSILLDTIQEYQVRYISSDEEISEAVNKADKRRVLLFRTIRRGNKERIYFDIPRIADDV